MMRTKRSNNRPALRISTLPVQRLNLHPGEESLVCPDCGTWRRITGIATPKLVPHRAEAPKSGQRAERCPASGQLVTLDVPANQWLENLTEASKDAAARRGTKVTRKPRPKPTPAVSKMGFTYPTLRSSLRAHRASCSACRSARPCDHGQLLQQRINRLVQSARQNV